MRLTSDLPELSGCGDTHIAEKETGGKERRMHVNLIIANAHMFYTSVCTAIVSIVHLISTRE